MNRYNLTDEVRTKYKPIVAAFLEKINNMSDDEICESSEDNYKLDLSNTELNPYTLGILLEEEFEFEDKDHEDNGWQMDFWITYNKNTSERVNRITIMGTGIIFEMFLSVEVG